MSEKPKKLTFVYEKSDGKKTYAVTGAFGGPTPNGQTIVAHLFVEYGTVPSYTAHEVGKGGVVNLGEGDSVKRGDATREIQATIVLSPEEAVRVGKWLKDHGDAAIDKRSAKNE